MENDLTLKKKNKKLLRLEAGMNLQNIMLGEKPDWKIITASDLIYVKV